MRMLMTVFLGAFLTGACAQTVEDRVETLEKKVDRILELLEKNQGVDKARPAQPAGPDRRATGGESAEDRMASPSGKGMPVMQKGTILSAYLVTKETYRTPQSETPVVRNVRDSTAEFKVANFLLSADGKLFEKNQVGVKWEGYLNVKEAGLYEFVSKGARQVAHRATGLLSVEGQSVVTQDSSNREANFGSIKLDGPGLYAIEVWMDSSSAGDARAKIEFQFRKSGEAKFENITPGSLYCLKGP